MLWFSFSPVFNFNLEFIIIFLSNRNMGGQIPPNNWKGALNISYRIGPGFTDGLKSQ